MRTPAEYWRVMRIRRKLRRTATEHSRNATKSKKLRKAGTIILAIGITAGTLLAAGFAIVVLMGQPYRTLPDYLAAQDTEVGDSFPRVDWERWHADNPQVIAWITIPGTDIDLPVAQGMPDDPDFYLGHDLYGNVNCYGCIYLDPDCNQGFNGKNCIVYGHNMAWDNAMFGPLENYADRTYAWQHRAMLLQTPSQRETYEVCAVQVVNGEEAKKQTAFVDSHDFARWWKKTYQSCNVRLFDRIPETARVLTLCTCSYSTWENERTLVYAIPKESA